MPLEIERKFLVTGEYKSLAYASSRIRQGYICSGGGRTVRVRIGETKVISPSRGLHRAGCLRYEFETEIPVEDAQELMGLL